MNSRWSPGRRKKDIPITLGVKQEGQPFALPKEGLKCASQSAGKRKAAGDIPALLHDSKDTIIAQLPQPPVESSGGNGSAAATVKSITKNWPH